MNIKTYVELNEDGKSYVGAGSNSKDIMGAILGFAFCFGTFAAGFYFYQFFMRSPLIKIVGIIFGFVLSVISWGLSMLFAGIFFGNFDFAGTVFSIFWKSNFQSAIGFLFLIMPIAIIITRVIKRIELSCVEVPLIVFSLLIIIFSVFSIINNIVGTGSFLQYFICFFVSGIIYLLVFIKATEL